ncbi:putative alpha crystallin/Hsp20 domain, HSP20-like chaperone [Helianthus annuus]|nr:putative alpha crystallin/Hsp20 domain, HSP20-like chaperone [Helianthus annuus]
MDSQARSTSLQTLLSYDDIEPLCTWQREDAQDVLVIHLPVVLSKCLSSLHVQEFKKEQLRVQISNAGLLKISGEKDADGKKRTRFLKEVKVTKHYDSNNIRAKFSQGCLRITLPKIVVTQPSMAEIPLAVVTPSLQNGRSDSINTNEKTYIPNIKKRVVHVLKSKTFTRVVVNVGFASVVAFSVYTAYKYWTLYVKTD